LHYVTVGTRSPFQLPSRHSYRREEGPTVVTVAKGIELESLSDFLGREKWLGVRDPELIFIIPVTVMMVVQTILVAIKWFRA